MIKYYLIPLGIFASSAAQMLLKKASPLTLKDISFYIYFCSAAAFYVASFGLYTLALRYFPITKISPIMTLGTMAMVIMLGIFIFHETMNIKQIIGLILGAVAIILIVS